MIPARTHAWNVTPKEAIAIQNRLRTGLILDGDPGPARIVCGLDVSYSRGSTTCYAAAVVLRFPEGEVVEVGEAVAEMTFPYVPGLLTFREGPAALAALEQIQTRPGLLMLDGQGLAHPRRFGLASHLGYLMDLPAVGCAKTILTGTHGRLGDEPGDTAPLVDGDEVVGAAVRTKRRVKPVFVSQGHRVSLDAAMRAVLETTRGYRLPEPTRQAHLAVNRLRREREGR